MSFVRKAGLLLSSHFLALLIESFRSVLLLRLLNPTAMGAWKTAMLLYNARPFLQAGVARGADVRISQLIGAGQHEEAGKAADSGGTFTIGIGALLALTALIFSFSVDHPDLKLAFRLLAFAIGIGLPGAYMIGLANARRLYPVRSRETLITALVGLVSVVLLCPPFQLLGLGLSAILGSISTVVILGSMRETRFSLRFDPGRIVQLSKAGLPPSFVDGGFDLLRRLDITMISILLGPTQVGYYALSGLMIDFASVFAERGVSQTLTAQVLTEQSRQATGSVAQYYRVPLRLFSYTLPLVLGIGCSLLSLVVPPLLPQYTAGIPAAEINAWSLFFVGLHKTAKSYFIAGSLIPSVLKWHAVVLVAGLSAQAAVLLTGLGITGSAWAGFGTMLAMSTGELVLVFRKSGGFHPGQMLTTMAPLGYAMALHYWLRSQTWANSSELLLAAAFVAGYAPLLLLFERRYGMCRMVLGHVTGRPRIK